MNPTQPSQPSQPNQPIVPLRPKQARRDRNIVTPFGELLTAYMAKQRPIWSTGRLGRKLGIRRQTVANWVYHDITPPIEVMLTVLAKLDIPISELVKAYQSRGVAVPTLAPPEELERLNAAQSTTQPTTQPATQPATPQQRAPTPEEAAQAWAQMVEQTRAVMLATGFPEQALDALLASLQQRESPTSLATLGRYLAGEHAPQRPHTASGQAGQEGQPGQPDGGYRSGPSRPLHIHERE